MADETQTIVAVEKLLHKGRIHEPGEELEVAVHDAERLIRNGAAKTKGTVHRLLKSHSKSASDSD